MMCGLKRSTRDADIMQKVVVSVLLTSVATFAKPGSCQPITRAD